LVATHGGGDLLGNPVGGGAFSFAVAVASMPRRTICEN
jgi:hypothetical protein